MLKKLHLHEFKFYHLLLAMGVVLSVSLQWFLLADQRDMHRVKILTTQRVLPITVEYAATPEQRARGLMYRDYLADGEGMLFLFERPLVPSFWMKNTLIPLDILFIDDHFVVRHVEKNVPPCPKTATRCPSYSPRQEVMYVLELPGGYSHEMNIDVGDLLIL